MIFNKKTKFLIIVVSFIITGLIDYVNISNYIDIYSHLDNTISNTITFISILIGFISTIYVMLQQDKGSYILELFRKNDLLIEFNNLFKSFVFTGFFDVFVLILVNFISSNFILLKIFSYIVLPVTFYFFIISIDILFTIVKMILSEEKLKSKVTRIKEEDVILK